MEPDHLSLANAAVQSAHARGIGESLKRLRLEKATLHFTKGLSSARSHNDLVALRVGVITAQSELLVSLASETWTYKSIIDMKHTITQLLSEYHTLLLNPFTKAPSLRPLIEGVCSAAFQMNASQERVQFLQWLYMQLPQNAVTGEGLLVVRLEVFGHVVEEIHHQAVRDFEAGNWAKALNSLKSLTSDLDTNVDREDKLSASSKPENRFNFNLMSASGAQQPRRLAMLRGDVGILMLSCEGSQLLQTGDLHFTHALRSEPEKMLAWAQLAQDDYREALSRVTGCDIELEGSVLSRLARFHSQVTKLASVGHSIYLRAIQVGLTLAPAQPKGNWYSECVKAVQDYRDKLEAQEASKWTARRIPILAELQEEMDKLESHSTLHNQAFAEWLWKEWPPKSEGSEDFPTGENLDVRKMYLKVIQRYHPDRNMKYGDKWHVLAEELSKALNNRYANMKGI